VVNNDEMKTDSGVRVTMKRFGRIMAKSTRTLMEVGIAIIIQKL
jgi:hypothetical protein